MGLLSVPLKTILIYHADLQSESMPESYAVCDGTVLNSTQQDINPGGNYTVPDLRNIFLIGADLTKAAGNTGSTTNSAAGAPGPKGTGGQHAKTLVTAELPSHSHTGTVNSAGGHTHAGSTADSGGSHTHTATTTTAGAHSHSSSTTSTVAGHTHAGSSTAAAGSHSHSVTDPGHTHSVTAWDAAINGPTASGAINPHSGTTGSSTTGISIDPNGNHSHTVTLATDGSHSHTVTLTSDGDHTHTITVASGGAHTHTLTLLSDGAHTHTVTGNNTGGDTAFDTRPRFYGVIYIMKVKR